jgi:hypothetical protein
MVKRWQAGFCPVHVSDRFSSQKWSFPYCDGFGRKRLTFVSEMWSFTVMLLCERLIYVVSAGTWLNWGKEELLFYSGVGSRHVITESRYIPMSSTLEGWETQQEARHAAAQKEGPLDFLAGGGNSQ